MNKYIKPVNKYLNKNKYRIVNKKKLSNIMRRNNKLTSNLLRYNKRHKVIQRKLSIYDSSMAGWNREMIKWNNVIAENNKSIKYMAYIIIFMSILCNLIAFIH